MTTRLSKAARARRTRRALLDVGRALFADVGYARTTTGELVRRAGVTRGALYYHFRDKSGLFEAVFDEVHQEFQAMRTCMETAKGDPWERFLASLRELITQLGHPSVQRIVAVDGPAVLDSSHVRHRPLGPQFLRAVCEQLVAEGVLKPLPLDPLCRLVWTACFEAALYIAQPETRGGGQQDMIATLMGLLGGLRRQQEAGGRQD